MLWSNFVLGLKQINHFLWFLGMAMHNVWFQTKKNKIEIKDSIEPQCDVLLVNI